MPYNNLISRTDAAALIPEEVSSQILRGLSNESAAMSAFTTIRVPSAQTRLPVLSALPTAYFVTGDTGLKQTTEANWANKYLNVEEIAAIVPIPEAVLDDADFDVWGAVQPLVQDAIARTLDAAVFFGTNAPGTWPTAVVTAAVSAGNFVARGTNAAAAGGIAADISDTLATLEADGYDANTAVANRVYRGFLRDARDSQGVRLAEVTSDSAYGIDVTYPMRGLWPTGVSAAEFVAMDRSEFILGVRQDITYKLLTEAVIQDNTGAIVYNLPQQDMVALRAVFRVGWQVANTINYDASVEANRYPAAVLRSPAS